MSIILHTGTPGSGKSFYCVYQLMHDKKIQEQYYVLHNIDGLKKEHFTSEEYIKDWRELFTEEEANQNLTKEYFEPLVRQVRDSYKRNILLIIDECQTILDKSTPEVKKFLSWHRHEGLDIWLICQDSSMIARDYRKLVEYEIRGNKSHVIDQFIYTFQRGRVPFRTKRLRKAGEVFAAYTSFQVQGAKQRTSKIIPIVVAVTLVSVGVLVYSIYALPSSMARSVGQSGTETRGKLPPKVDQVQPQKQKLTTKAVMAPSRWVEYTLAGGYGDTVLLQDASGKLTNLSSIEPEAKVLSLSRSEAKVITPRGIETITRQSGLVRVAEQRGSGGGVSPPVAEPVPNPIDARRTGGAGT